MAVPELIDGEYVRLHVVAVLHRQSCPLIVGHRRTQLGIRGVAEPDVPTSGGVVLVHRGTQLGEGVVEKQSSQVRDVALHRHVEHLLVHRAAGRNPRWPPRVGASPRRVTSARSAPSPNWRRMSRRTSAAAPRFPVHAIESRQVQ